MKKLILLLLWSSTIAHADGVRAEKPIMCYPTKTFLKQIKEKYQEEPMIVGKTTGVTDVFTAFYVNKETGTFTVAEIDKEAACVISLGTDIRYRYPKFELTL